ncbi:MAG: L-seryl-tRNA(Sec) selenium transferase [Candidatus Zixiibacteriota bacterium]
MNKRQSRSEPSPPTRPPSVEVLLEHASLAALIARDGRPAITEDIRAVVGRYRDSINVGDPWPGVDEIIADVIARAATRRRRFPQRVINATGVLLHTNLGRAPWDRQLVEHVLPQLTSYVSLEFDLECGTRGRRGAAVEAELASLAEAEAGLIVNNNAAAVYLVLTTLAWGREVVISRGELVQIGGGFRIPEILARSGAVLREVGTTNQTVLADYEKACGPQTALILKVHRSNFVQTGFVSEVEPRDLASFGRHRGIPVVWDLGSGAVGPGAICAYSGEPTLRAAVGCGADLVTASGDKLLGGPQAGIILGRTELINRLRKDPFYRALRPGKNTLLAMEETVAAHRAGRAETAIPLYRLLAVPVDELHRRASSLTTAAKAAGWQAETTATADTFGGGAAPGKTIPGWGLSLSPPPDAGAMADAARAFTPPIIGTIVDGRFVLSLRTMFAADDDDVARFLKSAARG